MNIKLELLSDSISELVKSNLGTLNIDADRIVDTKAVEILSKIQKIVQDETLSDFEALEEIVIIFEKYGVNAGSRHDFG